MAFDSFIFIYYFVPVMILLLAFVREKWRSIALLSLSLLFYYYGTGLHVLTMLGMASANYYGAAFIRAHDDGKQRKRVLILLISLNLAILAFFKYSGFIIENLNIILLLLGQSPIVYEKKVLIPLGISFITFHNVSLIVDVYRKSAPDKPGLMQTLNYIFAFPKIIAGPVLRFEEYIKTGWGCEIGPESFVRGMRIFIIGLAKKSIIANTLGGTADMVFSIPSDSLTVLMSWCGIFAYTMQLYFDFSGYSDMAVGIAKVVGLNLPENFNYPYTASSIRDFWRRWHMTMTGFFMNYLYIPLGGNRAGKARTYANLYIVFFVTGLWHGANWTFIVWGLYHGTLMVFERFGFGKRLDSIWKPLRHLYVILAIMIGWVFFRSSDIGSAVEYLKCMFGAGWVTEEMSPIAMVVDREFVCASCLAIIGSSRLMKNMVSMIDLKFSRKKHLSLLKEVVGFVILILTLLISSIYIAAGTNAPFIYQNF